ncbi:hypothetical protein G5V59_11700 [Nocardioides sp. W3-2-3]|nr:hypothetical protein [Nocardioides convexus]
MRTLVQTGYIQPTRLTVALTDAFLQPDQAPEHATVFTQGVRSIVLPPLMTKNHELATLVTPDIRALVLTLPDVPDLQAALAAIDEKSRSLLDPDYEPSESPSGSATPSGSASPSGSVSPSGSATDDRKRD